MGIYALINEENFNLNWISLFLWILLSTISSVLIVLTYIKKSFGNTLWIKFMPLFQFQVTAILVIITVIFTWKNNLYFESSSTEILYIVNSISFCVFGLIGLIIIGIIIRLILLAR